MRIVCISDTHGHRRELPAADLLIHAGDLTHLGSFDELKREVAWLASQTQFKHKVFVPGNHDTCLGNLYTQGKEGTLRRLVFEPAGVHYLRDSSVSVDGVLIYGSPWVPHYDGNAFNAGDLERKARWERIPAYCDVLVTHGPPKGVLDCGHGCPELTRAVALKAPRVHVFGHEHNAGGKMLRHGGTLFMNCAGHVLTLTRHK